MFLFLKNLRQRYLCIGLVLAAILLFAGCPMEENEHEDTGFIPIGEWNDGFGSGYNISSSSVEYYSPDYGEEYPAQSFTGSIIKAVDFSNNTGVLIIKIIFSENIDLTPDKYTCVYYKEYTNNHVFLANPIGPEPSYESIEVDTLNNALVLFTAGNMTTHVTYWGSGYTK